MNFYKTISGTSYFFYYLTFGYFFDYDKNKLVRKLCVDQWNGKNILEMNNIENIKANE
jgi:hypothetical protein